MKKTKKLTIHGENARPLGRGTIAEFGPETMFVNPEIGKPNKRKDVKFVGSKKHNVSYIFFSKKEPYGVAVHGETTLRALRAAIKSAECRMKRYKFDRCMVHIGNLSLWVGK